MDWLLEYALGLLGAMGLGASLGGALYAVWRGVDWLTNLK